MSDTATVTVDEELDVEQEQIKKEQDRLAKWRKRNANTFRYGPFRVLVSAHIQCDPETGLDRVYDSKSPPFMSNKDLLILNAPGMSPKFALVGVSSIAADPTYTRQPGESIQAFSARISALAAAESNTQGLFQDELPVVTPDGLENLTEGQLKQKAKTDKIELHGVRTKDEILGVMRAAYTSRKAKESEE